ncbi:HIT family protein [Streptomyces sp. NPDC101221]|uniref:HIT family protein n=1 Tax=Streptomyces sp. NPDC101221 TaxID=3366132 RepID=UPI0038283628
MKCEFCLIATHQAEAEIVYEDAENIAFFPLRPATLGHTLVIPKNHARDVFDISKEAYDSLFSSVRLMTQALNQALHPAGLNIINSTGHLATQSIFHIHVHLVPRWPDDRMGPIWPQEEGLPDPDTEELARTIRAATANS